LSEHAKPDYLALTFVMLEITTEDLALLNDLEQVATRRPRRYQPSVSSNRIIALRGAMM
jgi:hypothetical protein